MTPPSASPAQWHGPGWAGRAGNTGGTRRPVNKRYRYGASLGGQFPEKSGGLAVTSCPGVIDG